MVEEYPHGSMRTGARLRSEDLKRLLRAETGSLLGLVMELNQLPYYRNQLNAVELVSRIMQRRANGQRRHSTSAQR